GMLGRLWTMGARVEWSGLAAGEPRRRVPLPTYPFERQRCWVDRRKPDGTSRRRGRVRAEVYVPTWKRTPSPAPRPGDDARWLVFTDGSGGAALARRLEESGREVLTVEAGDAFVRRGARAYSLRPGSLDDCRALLRAVGVPGRVVFLAGPDDAPALDALARALAERGADAPARLDVVTRDAREVTGDEEGGGAAVLAALDAVRRDFPGIDCRSLDVPPAGPGSAAEARRTEQLLAELTGGAEEPVVAWRGSRRWVRSFEPVRGSAAAVREGGVYLVLGADGALARAVAERVAATPGARLLREMDGSAVDGVVFTPDGSAVEAPEGIEAGFRWVDSARAGEGWTSVDWRVGEVSGAVAARLLDAIAAAGDEREVVVSDGDPDAAPRPDVPALLAAPEPDPAFLYARPHLPNAYVAPSTDTERFVAGVWGDLLGVERVGVHDDFFSLGGHSLLAAQLLSRLRDGAGAELALRDVFESPTVAALAERVDAVRGAGGGHAPVVIRRVPRTGPLPLSPGQQRLWTLQQLEPDSPFYTVSESRHLKGRLEVGTLERALREVLRRHEALRSAYVEADGEPVQVPHDVPAAYLRVEDLGALPPEAREALARRRAQEEARRPVDLAAPPVLRTRLLRLGEEEHVLLTAVHHIAYDGWSAGVFWRELRVLYDVFAQGAPSPFPEPELQYADFAAWHRGWMETDAPAEDLAYWKEHLRGAPFVLDLPTDRPRPPVQGHRGALKTFTLDPALSAGLAELCRREGTTLHIVLLAAFEVLLLRYTGQEDMVVGSLAANRSHPGTLDLVGYFLNTVALRARLDGDPSFRALLGRVREVSLGADAHQYLPFDALLEELHVERDPSRNPLFQTMFILQQRAMHGWTPELPLLTFEHFEVDPGTAKFDLGLLLDELDGFLLALMEYDTDLFDRATAERMAEHYQALLRGAVEDPGRRLSDLPLLAPGERAQLLEGWNDTALEAPPARCVHDLFREQAARTPDAVAVVSEAGSLTYAELDRASDALAARLRARGVGPETRVGICLEPGPGTLAAVLGVLGAGGAYVPLDPKHPADRLAYVLVDSGARVVVTEEGLEGRFEGSGREVVVTGAVLEGPHPAALEPPPSP
ncbi:MAG TPA: condensation domain-containing protein, partial [Longimicrobiaceae bacterium]